MSLLWLGSLPVNQVYIETGLIEVHFENDVGELCGTDPAKEPIVLLKILPISLVSGHEEEYSLLELEKDPPVACHKEQIPEKDCGEDVQHIDDGSDQASSACIV